MDGVGKRPPINWREIPDQDLRALIDEWAQSEQVRSIREELAQRLCPK